MSRKKENTAVRLRIRVPVLGKRWLLTRPAQHYSIATAPLVVLNIDCGCAITRPSPDGFAQLCAFELTNRQLFFQENVELYKGGKTLLHLIGA